MLTGFNTDVEHRGEVFHVQTQDKGKDDPVVETLVYLGGRILASVSTPYTDLLDPSSRRDRELLERMKAQHMSLINSVLSGKFGDASAHDLNELVVDFLEQEIEEIGELEEIERPAPEDPGPDVETRKRRLQAILERLEAQIEKEARENIAPAPPPDRRAAWAYVGGTAVLLVCVIVFAPAVRRLPEPVAAPVTRVDPAPPPAIDVAPEMPPAGPSAVAPESPPAAVAPIASAPARAKPSSETSSSPVLSPPPMQASVSILEPPPPIEIENLPAQPVARPAPNWKGRLVPFSELDEPPLPTRREMPVYTRRAARQGQWGTVRLDLLIDEKGYVTQMKVVEKIPGSDLHVAAMDAASSWRFTPPRKAGQPVKAWKTVDLEFSIWPDETEVVKVRE